MKFSVIYRPTTLFSLKSSSATNSGAKSLLLPSPYAIKMAVLNQAITVGNELENLSTKKSKEFGYVRDAKIEYYIPDNSHFCVNNSFVKILKQKEDKRSKKQREEGVQFESGFFETVSFREYIYLSKYLEIVFDVENEEAKLFLKKYLNKINYFGKKGCFFQFINYSDTPNHANVKEFDVENFVPGIIEEYDDFYPKSTFEEVNNYSNKRAKRLSIIMSLPLKNIGSSKSYTYYKSI